MIVARCVGPFDKGGGVLVTGAVAVQTVGFGMGVRLEGAPIEFMLIGVIFRSREGRVMWSGHVSDVRRGREKEKKKWALVHKQYICLA